jgi:uncharacterized membrane protein YcgQ (UPF0703/DUF1980 family)
MKKIVISLLFCLLLVTGGCQDKSAKETGTGAPTAKQTAGQPEVVEIKEKMFVEQTNDVYYNPEDYLGNIIKYEGIFDIYQVPETGEKLYSVIRYGPGCCGFDANAGFQVVWDGDYPKQNDWVAVAGVLEEYELEGTMMLRLALSSLEVLDERGAEYVGDTGALE